MRAAARRRRARRAAQDPHAALARLRHRAPRGRPRDAASTSGTCAAASSRSCRCGRAPTPTCTRPTSKRSARCGSGSSTRNDVEARRDDVEGFARDVRRVPRPACTPTACIDYDEQIYGAIEVLLRERRDPARAAARMPAPARRRVPGPHARAAADAAPRRRARLRRVRRRRRRPGHLRLRRRRPRVPHRLRPVLPRRHAPRSRSTTAARPTSSARPRNLPRLQPAPRRQGDRRRQAGRRRPRSRSRAHAARASCRAPRSSRCSDVARRRRRTERHRGADPCALACCSACSCSARRPASRPNAPIGVEVLEPHRHAHRARVPAARARAPRRDALAGADLAIARPPAEPLDAARDAATHRRPAALATAAAPRLAATAEHAAGSTSSLDDLEALGRADRRRRGHRDAAAARSATTSASAPRSSTLDRVGRGPDASHRDDLNALIAVAALAAGPRRLRAVAALAPRPPRRPTRPPTSVTLSTVHRVKGMEWPYVVVLGAHDGLMPHHLADDIEEERRIFHVAITRATPPCTSSPRRRAPTPFLDELARPARRRNRECARRAGSAADSQGRRRVATCAEVGMELTYAGSTGADRRAAPGSGGDRGREGGRCS